MTLDDNYPPLATLLAPTIQHGPGMVFAPDGSLAVLPLTQLTPDELKTACRLHMIFRRGLLVVC